METLEYLRTYLTTKLRDYSESLTPWDGDLEAESNELFDKIQGNAQLEHVEYELKRLKDAPTFTIQYLVDIINSAMEALDDLDDTYIAHKTVASIESRTTQLYPLISFIDYYFQYNIGNVKFKQEEDNLVLYILKRIDNEDSLDMELGTNENQTLPAIVGASRLLNTLEHFYEDCYDDVKFELLPDKQISLLFSKGSS